MRGGVGGTQRDCPHSLLFVVLSQCDPRRAGAWGVFTASVNGGEGTMKMICKNRSVKVPEKWVLVNYEVESEVA